MAEPKLFVSYSWTDAGHEEWVLQLATELRESGVDVILDKWDLREGHDANAFMEQMVTDPEIEKVILVCDQAYADKADKRSGGVGTEAQIISGEIYSAQDQGKFVAVVKEHTEEGKPCLPAYYRSRIFIDLSDPSAYAENFEKLLRWIFNKPVHKKPEIGKVPTFLTEDETAITLATTARFKRAVDAVKNGRPFATAAVVEYFATFSAELEKLRLDGDADPFDDAVVQSIESFLPYRNEAVEMFQTLSMYLDNAETRSIVHRFFEGLIPYFDSSHRLTLSDNFKFIVHELFLYALASFIDRERFETAAHLLQSEYFVPGRSEYGKDAMVPFEVFRGYMQSLAERNKRLELRRASIRADMLSERCKGLGLTFSQLMQADFILFMRDHLDNPDGDMKWWPETLLYVGRHSSPLEVFARSRSISYFERSKVLLGIETKDDLSPLLEYFKDKRNVPRWDFESFSPAHLLGFEQLATKP